MWRKWLLGLIGFGEVEMDELAGVAAVMCDACENHFFVRADSEEFKPQFCCYCGKRAGEIQKGYLDDDQA